MAATKQRLKDFRKNLKMQPTASVFDTWLKTADCKCGKPECLMPRKHAITVTELQRRADAADKALGIGGNSDDQG